MAGKKQAEGSGGAGGVDALLDKGFGALEEGDLKLAFKMARKLEEEGHSACFELAALAHVEAGEVEEALEVLQRGLGKAPGVWILWQLRGNLCSDLDRFEEAEKAYRQGLTLEGCDVSSLSYNLALVLYRSGDLVSARRALEAVGGGGDTALPALALEVGLDLAQGKTEEAEKKACAALDSNDEFEADPVALAALRVHLGELLLLRQAKDEAREQGMRALEIDPVNQGAFALLREIDEPLVEEAKSFQILLEGSLRSSPELGFYKSYQVRAMDTEDALAKILSFETASDPDSLKIEESDELDFDLGPRTGVYTSSGYAFFDRD